MKPMIISKSSFVQGLKCHRKVWQLLWDRDSAGPRSGIDQLRMEFGIRFGNIAHCLYPDSVLIAINIRNLEKAEEDTRKAIEEGAKVILEATFRHEQCRVLSDVIERQPDGSWHLIEVKSSTYVKDEHIPDLAYQKWVMEKCGYSVSKCSVLFADKTGTWPDEPSIFQHEDVTEQVNVYITEVPEKLSPMLEIAASRGNEPRIKDWYSKECHECEYKKTVCWKDIREPTIYDLVHVSKLPQLEAQGILYTKDIPKDFPLNNTDRGHVDCVQAKCIDIDKPAIAAMIDKLEYPIYFLDFESASVAVPLFDGNHPWEKLAFQYSLHILEESGKLEHVEFLHEDSSDPSQPLAERLVNDIGATGSVVVYHKSMESGVLKRLAEVFPQYADMLNSMNNRIWDLEVVFKKHYRHWKFGSKSSIKVVLPVLVPELSYKDQAISDGGQATLSWIRMLESGDPAKRQQTADELKSYCKLDTLAMVELLKHLRSIVE